jgi:hypothetical protein
MFIVGLGFRNPLQPLFLTLPARFKLDLLPRQSNPD